MRRMCETPLSNCAISLSATQLASPRHQVQGQDIRPKEHEGSPAADAAAADDNDVRLADLHHALLAEEHVVASKLRTEYQVQRLFSAPRLLPHRG
jgi:hypothetical protein